MRRLLRLVLPIAALSAGLAFLASTLTIEDMERVNNALGASSPAARVADLVLIALCALTSVCIMLFAKPSQRTKPVLLLTASAILFALPSLLGS